MFTLSDAYPPDAIHGADFFSLAAQRTVVDISPTGGERGRKERVLVADRVQTFEDVLEGRICVSEQTVREMGRLVGLVDPASAERITRENRALRDENATLSNEVVSLRAALAAADLTSREVFVTPDGETHATQTAALRHLNPTPHGLVPAAPLSEAP